MTKGNILVVEDDALIAEELRYQVTKLGHNVVAVVHSGEDAIELASAHHPDLILMDLRPSGRMDGLEAGLYLQQSLGIVIVYVTATPVPSRMQHYISKPFVPSTIALVLEKALGSATS